MSLINDALKRAREANKQRGGEGSAGVPLQPVDYAWRPNPFLRFTAAVVLVAAVGLAVFYFTKWWQSREQLQRVTATTNVPPVQVQVASESAAAPESAATKYRIKVNTNIVARSNVIARAATPEPLAGATQTNLATDAGETAAPVNEFLDLKLQSIIYRLDKPAAVIGGEMLYVGDTIKGARVTGITRHEVTIEWKGKTNVLQLPRL
jgi:hypothetical protein